MSKGQTSLDLFNRFGEFSRDWKRVADTESVNIQNTAYVREVVFENGGKPTYLKRYELPGACKACERLNGKIALFSAEPLPNFEGDALAEFAVWEGKTADGKTPVIGAIHPNCRGSWIEYAGSASAYTAEVEGRAARWDAALKTARKQAGTASGIREKAVSIFNGGLDGGDKIV